MTEGHTRTDLRTAFAPQAGQPRPKPKHAPVSIRFTPEERAQIERDAGGKSLSRYIRERLFGSKAKGRTVRAPTKDHAALARVLSALGRSNLARECAALTKAAQDERVILDADSAAALRQACTDIAIMRQELVKALGLRPE